MDREEFMLDGMCCGCIWENDISGCLPFGIEGICEHYEEG